MPSDFTIELQPVGACLSVAPGTPLRDILFEQGVEFPCGGNGRCRGCKVRVVSGSASVNDAQREHLSDQELADGWRLACQCSVHDHLVIELRQWDATILADETPFAFTPQPGYGVAIDVGTTTLVAQLLDLSTGHVMAVKTALNPQARHGGDVMSRVQFAVAERGQAQLEELIRHEVGRLIHLLLGSASVAPAEVHRVVLVGNTVMHHLFSGVDLEPMSHYPFEPVDDGLQAFEGRHLGWTETPDARVEFLPCLGSFVGSDILAGVIATRVHESDRLVALIDLGTNGEIVLGTQSGLICASTAAGPAFEGARISVGMRAATGAIWAVKPEGDGVSCEVLGHVPARGICGSGLVDAVAAGLDLGWVKPTGRLAGRETLCLAEGVALTQTDVRQLQLAKGAIAAGFTILLEQIGAGMEDVSTLYLAGAFGNYVNRVSARRIGLLRLPEERIKPVGNTALLGAKLALFGADDPTGAYTDLRARVTHLSLNEDPRFQDVYVEEMSFPAG